MDAIFMLMLAAAFLIAIAISIGPHGIAYWVGSLKSKLTRSRKTKTDPTA